MQWSLLEHILLHTIFAITDTEHKEGEIIFGGLDMQPRVNAAINLARHHKAPKDIIDRLKAIRKEIQDNLSERRNMAVHGVHSEGDTPEMVKLHMPRLPEPKKRKQMSIAEMHKIGTDIKEQGRQAVLVFAAVGQWKFGGHRFETGGGNLA
jgi:transcriptional/translational regulatory protein YebC/TACO1